MKRLVIAGYGIMAGVNVLIILCLPLIMRIYNVSAEAERLAVTVVLIHGISSIFLWIPAFLFSNFLRAAGDARYTMLVSMGSMWLVRVLFAYILGRNLGYGVVGVWFSHAILDWIVRSAFFLARYRGDRWTLQAIR